MKKGVIYARYSCDNQSEQSIEGQLHVCRDFAKANDILIVDTYIDRAMTGTNDLRPDFQRMLMDSAKRQWEVVLVYKLDRFSRNKYEATIHKHTLKENGVKLISAMENIPDSPEGIILESLLEGMNQYYSAELKQKVNRGLRESWGKGQATGGLVIFGYRIENKRYVVNEYEAEIVREAYTLYAQGCTACSIADLFKAKGYRRKNGEYLDVLYIYKMLHSKAYTGVVERQGVVYDNLYPRIVPDELWTAVDIINKGNKRKTTFKKENLEYILSGKIICGECKHLMVGESGKSKNGIVHYYYSCHATRNKSKTCKEKPVRKKFIEDLVIQAASTILKDDDSIHSIAEYIFGIHQKEMGNHTAMKLLQQKLAAAKKAQGNIIKAIEQGIINDATKDRLQELDQEITGIEFDIQKEKARTYTYLTVEQIEQYLRKFIFDNTEDLTIRKMIVNTFIREIIVYRDKITITFNFTDRPVHFKHTKEQTKRREEEIEQAKIAEAPIQNDTNSDKQLEFVLFFTYHYFGMSINRNQSFNR